MSPGSDSLMAVTCRVASQRTASLSKRFAALGGLDAVDTTFHGMTALVFDRVEDRGTAAAADASDSVPGLVVELGIGAGDSASEQVAADSAAGTGLVGSIRSRRVRGRPGAGRTLDGIPVMTASNRWVSHECPPLRANGKGF